MFLKSKRKLDGGKEKQDPLLAQLRAALRIDKEDLDEDVVKHATFMDQVAERYTQLCSQRDLAHEHYEDLVEQHSLTLYASAKAKSTDNRKVAITKDEVSARVGQMRDVKRAWEEYSNLARQAAAWQTLLNSYEKRGRMIHELVKLYENGYWTPTSRGGKRPKEQLADIGREGQRRKRGNWLPGRD
jgi:hypothetical protein